MAESRRRLMFQLPWRSAARIQADVDEELRLELDVRTRELVEQGLSDDQARRRALEEFGDLETTRRYCADADRAAEAEGRRAEIGRELRDDARLVWRGMRRTPGFAALVLATLALGIGANTAVFSVVSRVLLHRLPYRAPEQLVRLYGATADDPARRGMLSAIELAQLQTESRTLAAVAPAGLHAGYTYVSDRDAEMWQGTRVGPTFFRALGAVPLLGRGIDDRDVGPQAAPVVMLSYALWQRSFGGDSSVIGRGLRLNGVMRTVVGVMPPDFVPPTASADIWVPLDLAALLRAPQGQGRMLGAVARLADGASLAQVRAELGVIARHTPAPSGEDRAARRVNVVPLREAMVGESRPVLLVVMGAAVLVLLVGCVNVAGLFLARATARRRELAVRTALGAGRGRLVRQLLTESMLIGLAGGAIGIALAYWGKNILVHVGDRVIPAMGDVRIDTGVLAFAVLASLASGAAFGLVPALVSTRAGLNSALAESSRGASGGRASARAGRVLVAGQIALAVILLVGAGLLGRTLVALERTGVGYTTEADVLTFRVNLSSQRYAAPGSSVRFFAALLERVRALPGVRAAGMVAISPWNGPWSTPFTIEGRADAAVPPPTVAYGSVSDGYFAALGVPLRGGRAFVPEDREAATPVAVISESVARQFWPGADPIGARVRLAPDSSWRTIVGVVGDLRERASAPVMPMVYVSAWQQPEGGNELVVRASGDAIALVPAVRRELRALDPSLPLVRPRTMDEVFRASLSGHRLPMLFTTAFAALALVLAAIGVYGVMAYAVAARRRELGIRAALGARSARIVWLIVRQGLATALVGTAIGLMLAAAFSRVLAGVLVGVTPRDVATFVAAPLVLLAVCVAACLIPARRATRADPVEVLRAD